MRLLALAQYEACQRVLAAESGIEPAPETAALYEQIREGRLEQRMEPDKRMRQQPSVYPLESAALFVARDRELAGQGRVVLVSGEAGSGKTALLAEFARRASVAHANLVVAGGNGNERLGQGDPTCLSARSCNC